MTWIPVKEGLPEDRQRVLTYWPSARYEKYRINLHGYHMGYGPTSDQNWWIGVQNFLVGDNRITHWQPLPEEPRQEEVK